MMPSLGKLDSMTRFMDLALLGSGGDSVFAYMNSAENPGAPLWGNLNFNSSRPPTIQGEQGGVPRLELEERRENFPLERPRTPNKSASIEDLVKKTYFANSRMSGKSPERKNEN
eukprot:TRINITY_DN1896_c0_g3_i2.p4 TRINITY_DN1896_c0_g3~~TRINITY_DN1896_c0_g3_i2.p4  ORF type:complete len:114 (+),score=38.19 TRINITY_DN1896_c0_g3_i2:986-1327(+)